jgi:hypothetical protein
LFVHVKLRIDVAYQNVINPRIRYYEHLMGGESHQKHAMILGRFRGLLGITCFRAPTIMPWTSGRSHTDLVNVKRSSTHGSTHLGTHLGHFNSFF